MKTNIISISMGIIGIMLLWSRPYTGPKVKMPDDKKIRSAWISAFYLD